MLKQLAWTRHCGRNPLAVPHDLLHRGLPSGEFYPSAFKTHNRDSAAWANGATARRIINGREISPEYANPIFVSRDIQSRGHDRVPGSGCFVATVADALADARHHPIGESHHHHAPGEPLL